MATNGVYFGAEIVRDLTPAPGSRMAKRRGRRRERVGWGRAGRGSLHLRLPLSCFSHLHPSLSFSVHLSLCLLPPLAVKPPPHVCLLLSGQDSRPLVFGTQVPLPEGENKDPWTNQEDSQGAGRGRRGWHWQGARDEHESQLPTALLIFPPSFEAPSCLCCLALVPKKHLGEVELVKSRPQILPSCPGHSCCLGLLKPFSGHTLCYLYCCN